MRNKSNKPVSWVDQLEIMQGCKKCGCKEFLFIPESISVLPEDPVFFDDSWRCRNCGQLHQIGNYNVG